jgi:hypothetical protein
VWDTSQKVSGTQSSVDSTTAGTHQHYFTGATATLNAAAGELLFTYVLVDPCNLPREIMVQWNDGGGWEHRAFWGENIIGWGNYPGPARTRMGDMPPANGNWIRLTVPSSSVGLSGVPINGISFVVYGGRAWFDRAGKASCSTPIATAPSSFPTGDTVWFDDSMPAGATPTGTWNWDTTQKASGTQSILLSSLSSSQDATFDTASATMTTGANDTLFAYVMLDPCEPPREITMRWNVGGDWGYVAYWGDDMARFGYSTRMGIGPLPAAGTWARLQVPAWYPQRSNKTIRGMQILVWGGKAWIDRVGKGTCTTPIAGAPSSFPGTESIWFDDNVPAGATTSGTWTWDTTQKASGSQSHTMPLATWGGTDERSFTGAPTRGHTL